MKQSRVAFLVAVTIFGGVAGFAQASSDVNIDTQANQGATVITLRWGAHARVSRYRLQLAGDAAFSNIVLDRVVTGHEYAISDLPPGRYFWRVAPLTTRLGAFSSAEVIEVSAGPKEIRATQPGRTAVTANTGTGDPATVIRTSGGWYAAVGNVGMPIQAHLRAPNSLDLVATADDGRVMAIDAVSGRALWITRLQTLPPESSTTPPSVALAIRTDNGLDNVLLLGRAATILDGRTGRTLSQTNLPATISRATVSGDQVFAMDSSFQRLFILNASDGKVLSDVRLARRAVGDPISLVRNGAGSVMIALDDGRLLLFDQSGKMIIEGNSGGPATTGPLVVHTARGELVLVGTSNGLTALDDDLRPLGRVTLKGDEPRGTLIASDLDRDGILEVVTFTHRGRVVVVKSDEGKIVWEADSKQVDATAFADINGDGVLDLLMMGREEFAFALSGRDGALIWKSDIWSGVATNHAASRSSRSPFVITTSSSVLLVGADPFGGGLRALEFHNRAAAPR